MEGIIQKTIEQLQIELDREKEYTTKLNRQIDRLQEQLRNTISIQEHEKILSTLRQECEDRMAKIKNQQFLIRNPRGAGRKKKATKQVVVRVRELRAEGFSQQILIGPVTIEGKGIQAQPLNPKPIGFVVKAGIGVLTNPQKHRTGKACTLVEQSMTLTTPRKGIYGN